MALVHRTLLRWDSGNRVAEREKYAGSICGAADLPVQRGAIVGGPDALPQGGPAWKLGPQHLQLECIGAARAGHAGRAVAAPAAAIGVCLAREGPLAGNCRAVQASARTMSGGGHSINGSLCPRAAVLLYCCTRHHVVPPAAQGAMQRHGPARSMCHHHHSLLTCSALGRWTGSCLACTPEHMMRVVPLLFLLSASPLACQTAATAARVRSPRMQWSTCGQHSRPVKWRKT